MLGDSVAVSPRCGAAKRVSWRVLRRRRRLSVQWTAMRGILRSTDRPPRSQCGLSSLQVVDFFLLLPNVVSISADVRLVHHLSAATGRHLDPSFFIRISWLSDRYRLIPVWLSSLEFNGWILFLHISYGIVPSSASRRRSHSMLGAVVGSPYVPSFTAPLWRLVCIRSLTRQRITVYRWGLPQ